MYFELEWRRFARVVQISNVMIYSLFHRLRVREGKRGGEKENTHMCRLCNVYMHFTKFGEKHALSVTRKPHIVCMILFCKYRSDAIFMSYVIHPRIKSPFLRWKQYLLCDDECNITHYYSHNLNCGDGYVWHADVIGSAALHGVRCVSRMYLSTASRK